MYKWCLVPGCTNTTIKTPEKLFVCVPKKPKVRKMWLKLAGRNPDSVVDDSTVFFCEDHFNVSKYITYYYSSIISQFFLLAICFKLDVLFFNKTFGKHTLS